MHGLADTSYKFGTGRMLMEHGLLEHIGDELRYFGKRPYLIGGPTAQALIRPRIEEGLHKSGLIGTYGVHAGHVCHQAAREKAQEAQLHGCDVVIAVGGGRAMDFGKLVAYYANTSVICLPTSASTCAAYTPFSLVYTPEGKALPGNFCYDLENAALWIDLDIMAMQPPRYLISGMLDAMAKMLEIKNGSQQLHADACPKPLYAGYLLAQYSYEQLLASTDTVLRDLAEHRMSPALQDTIFFNIPLTGIISGLSRGVGQSAIAHAIYYQLRTLFPEETSKALHGEIVGLGLIPQMYYNGEADQVEGFRHFLQHVQAPTCLSEVGFPLSDQHFEQLCSALVSSEYVAQDAASRARFAQAMALIAH